MIIASNAELTRNEPSKRKNGILRGQLLKDGTTPAIR
jgi:hypothetical protein